MPVAAGAQCELPRCSSSSSSHGECHPCACVSGVVCASQSSAVQNSAGELPVPCSALQLVAVWRQWAHSADLCRAAVVSAAEVEAAARAVQRCVSTRHE